MFDLVRYEIKIVLKIFIFVFDGDVDFKLDVVFCFLEWMLKSEEVGVVCGWIILKGGGKVFKFIDKVVWYFNKF